MPPEPLPWDRKDFFKERKHERSESLGSVARWRDSPHHAPRDFNRWASGDFRRPPGHGKQGGWHVFSDDSGHGYGSSRSGDKMVEDESFRPSFSRGDGRYGRNSRDNRGPPYSQRESKGYSWETRSGSPNMLGRPNRVNNEQRSQDDMLTYSSHQQSDFGSTWDQIQLKDQLDKMGGSTGLGSGQKCERENSLVSIDWKPLKWTRSGSMSSRGSGFSHSSSSKSMGPIDSNEAKVESQPKTATPVQSPSGEATNCVTSAAPLEETTSRKKPRLGWGEGLAKYEKKKVDVPDGSMNKDAAVCSVGNTEPAHSLSSSLPDKSPRVTVFSDCASPATPSSVACSSSPEKTDPSTCGNSSMLLDSEVVAPDSGVVVDKLCDSIFSANKIFASRASDIFSKLLSKEHISGVSVSSSWKNDSLIKEKFAKRKRHLRFMERVITLKFKAFQHLWKEDMSVLSMRKYRSKSHKKFELSLRATNNGHQKHRSSIRLRFSTPGSLSLVPTTEIINFTNKLLSDSQVKPYRNLLKMPALILDKEEKLATRFVSSNGLVEDPCAVEKERALMNPWTPEEKELFIQKLTTYGKDFRKISSFLDHKTTADCVEFYYKHHKSDCFVKTKKKPDMAKQGKSSANTYLISDGKKWNREMDAASLDILGAASAIAAHADGGTRNRQTYSRRLILGAYRNTNTSRSEDTTVERSCSLDTIGNERETAAADVLAGICGSMSSEAVSSCITSSIDPGESYLEWKCQKGDSVVRRPLTPDVMQNVDDETCSDESCGEMDPSDWTDEEKSRFIQAVSSYGKDFAMISRCIRSRSQHQCKVFFSKARKCLGLDFVHPGPGNGTSVGDDANGGGSDTEDACVLETGSGISSDKSGCNVNEDVPPSVTNMNADEADPAETMKLQTSPPRPEENNVMGEVDHGDGKPLKSLASDAFQTVDKPKLVFDGDTDIMDFDAMGGNATENKILVAESRPVGEGINSDPPNPECMVGEKLIGQISSDRFGKKLEGSDERSNRDPSGCCLPASAHNSCGNTSDVAADGSCSGPGLNPECPCQVSVELNSVQNPSVISLTHENAPATAVSVPQDSAVIECEKSLSQDRLSSTLDLREGSVGRDESRKHLSGLLGHANVEPLQVLRGYPLQMVPKKETNGDVSCGNLSEVKPDRNINGHYMTQDDFLQFGNSKPQCSRVDCPPLPLKVEKPGDARKAHSWSSTDSDKPSRNGDVKLFGKILSNPSSLSQSNGSIHENEEEGAHNQKLSSKSSNLNLTGHHSADGNSPLLKFDCSSYLGLENVPSRSYGGFWEGNKVQAGNSSFADSAILLAKYPAAFSNFPTSSSQMEQQPLQAVVKTNDRSMNGISVFRGEEINGSNGVADYPVFSRGQDGGNKVQPFTVDVKQQQRQDVLDIPRRNGFDAISSIQQQGRGSVGMNVVGRGGILVGGPCTVVSDPVAAIRMHYAKTEQYGGQAGSIFRKEESWRGGKGDIGR
ncbi:hypothetical protein DVH24_023973 [Malus domestica]|uniref:SANT domain-containing protein n=1 Tax=Malus domestica TaxID=3750 RepID=A0A498JEK1_MALDO|nr:hypothetical protein DVH24_023973 [Malus domestica]